MNLMPTLISIGLAASVSLFYLQNQKDEPNKINYRAALSEFEQSAIAFAAHTPLDSNNPQPQSHCQNLVSDFSDQLPAGTQWTVDIAGLDCDMAVLSLEITDNDDFNNLLSAATASGRSYVTETNTSTTPSTKIIKWTQRLYTRTAADLGIRAQLKNNLTNSCLASPCRSVPVAASTVTATSAVVKPIVITPTSIKAPSPSPITPIKIPHFPKLNNTQTDIRPSPNNSYKEGKWVKGECSKKCGGGIYKYHCIVGNSGCDPDKKPSEKCNTQNCPINGGWSDWSPCIKSCGDEMQKQYCNKPKPQYEGKQCQRIDGSFTSETNNWQIKSCNLKACNRRPVLVVDDLNPKMPTNDPIEIVAEAYDPDNKPLIFRKHEDLIEIKASENMGTYKRTYKYPRLDKSQKNDPYSYYDGVNKFNRFDKHEVFVKACNPDNCSPTANIAISVIEINDPPSIKQSHIYPVKPIFDRDFHVQFEITDPDYDFNNIPPSYYGSYKLTFDSWLTCSQQGHKVGSILIDCNGIPKEKEDNKFTIYIKFSDGNSTAEEYFKYEAIDYADYLNP